MSASDENVTPRRTRAVNDETSAPPQAIIHEYEAPGGEPFPSFVERLRATAMTVNGESPMHTLYPSVTRV